MKDIILTMLNVQNAYTRTEDLWASTGSANWEPMPYISQPSMSMPRQCTKHYIKYVTSNQSNGTKTVTTTAKNHDERRRSPPPPQAPPPALSPRPPPRKTASIENSHTDSGSSSETRSGKNGTHKAQALQRPQNAKPTWHHGNCNKRATRTATPSRTRTRTTTWTSTIATTTVTTIHHNHSHDDDHHRRHKNTKGGKVATKKSLQGLKLSEFNA